MQSPKPLASTRQKAAVDGQADTVNECGFVGQKPLRCAGYVLWLAKASDRMSLSDPICVLVVKKVFVFTQLLDHGRQGCGWQDRIDPHPGETGFRRSRACETDHRVL